ncbi:MAG TPA: glycoside hydrolase family 32 protein [Flavisolibacter sp.]|jgi:fructan beta-fructosidase|nr:glycoside hydrolase family 32 protein [Flavisolibacter sp.]
MKALLSILTGMVILTSCNEASQTTVTKKEGGDSLQHSFNEPHRPQLHFSPEAHWMNDPNGMLFYNNTYHLFYQYYPDSTVWGPMHWGHATSTDLVHWTHQPIALYPDSLGYIFSGSAVADVNNTSGFGKDGKVPLVAIFTHHNPDGEKSGSTTYQNQSLAYSLDEGKTWTKYAGNPVLKNPGIKDFRDPKVSWHADSKKWIMTLATLDRISFYSSPDLKSWTKESEFGKQFGAHGGVWECPDLFPMDYQGKKIWVLLVSINPGGPNGGSATQYFTGTFDGKTFTPFQTDIRWIDNGPDDYAGVTWGNTGDRRLFLGWMGNWQYAQVVPTKTWRSAMTVPRDLSLEKIGDRYFLRSQPAPELDQLNEKPEFSATDMDGHQFDLTAKAGKLSGPSRLRLASDHISSYTITLSNASGEKVVIGYDSSRHQYYIDRTASGETAFEKGFAGRHTAPRIALSDSTSLELIIDKASVELFADNGLTVMTEIFFPKQDYTDIRIASAAPFQIKKISLNGMRSIYQ